MRVSMPAIEVLVRKQPALPLPAEELPTGILDFIVDGINVTARLGQGPAFALLAELCAGVVALSRGKRDRFTAAFYSGDEAWEIGLETDASAVLISVYRTAPSALVAVHERRVELVALREALLAASGDARDGAGRAAASLTGARASLATPGPSYGRAARRRLTVRVATPSDEPVAVSASIALRTALQRPLGTSDEPHVERSDLGALLAKGSVTLRAGEAEITLASTYPFLFAEELLSLGEEAVRAEREQRALFRRSGVDSVKISLRSMPAERGVVLKVKSDGADTSVAGAALNGIDARALARAAARFALGLEAALSSTDPGQTSNLRLQHLTRAARALEQELTTTGADDSLTNPDPESYASFGLPRRESARGKWHEGGKMRFFPRWVAAVPNIDLGATFQCGDRMIVGSPRQTACLDRVTGAVIWRRALPRAATVPTPFGLVRMTHDGEVTLHELEHGETRFSLHLAPRNGGGAVGAVVNAPGLPRLLAVAERDRSVTAVDLVSGDVRWRYTAARPAAFKLRRAGRLLLVAGGDSALVALDASTGDVVWRLRDRLPFTGDLSIDRDTLFATAGGPVGPTRLLAVDLWRGELRWSRELPARPAPGQAPLVTADVVAVSTRDRRGSGVLAFTRETGELVFGHEPGLSAPTTSWLAVDDVLVANSASGALIGIDASDGSTRYHKSFPRHVDADQPRRLEPVLRSGALFVPQHQVHVVRPADGSELGVLPSDLIPDLLRVDEDLNVYVAEESGHVAAFGVAPRLALVR
jgi:outer membrane protein assembly factor BamB